MDDRITRASRNYFFQKRKYDDMMTAIARADEMIEAAQRVLAEAEIKLPHLERRFLAAKKLYDSFGDRDSRDRQRKRYQLICEIAKLEGKKPPPEPKGINEEVVIPEEPESYDVLVDGSVACRHCGHVGTFLDFSDTLDPSHPCTCPKCRSDQTTYDHTNLDNRFGDVKRDPRVPTVWGTKGEIAESRVKKEAADGK